VLFRFPRAAWRGLKDSFRPKKAKRRNRGPVGAIPAASPPLIAESRLLTHPRPVMSPFQRLSVTHADPRGSAGSVGSLRSADQKKQEEIAVHVFRGRYTRKLSFEFTELSPETSARSSALRQQLIYSLVVTPGSKAWIVCCLLVSMLNKTALQTKAGWHLRENAGKLLIKRLDRMTISVELDPEMEARLMSEAQSQGIPMAKAS